MSCAKINNFTRATIKNRMLDIFRKGTKTVSLVLKYRIFKVAFLFNLQFNSFAGFYVYISMPIHWTV